MTAVLQPIRQVAILGAGRVGTAVARTLLDVGYDVSIAGSGDPADVEIIVRFTAPGARALWAAEATRDADLVVLAVPLHRLPSVDPESLRGRLVVDAMNYWPAVDGIIPAFENAPHGSSAVVKRLLSLSRVIKTLNHTGYHDLEPDRRPDGHPERLGMAVAGDDIEDLQVVAELIDRIGYDPVILDRLEHGTLLQPGTALFGARPTAALISQTTAAAMSRAA